MALRGKENANSNDVKGWVGASENYTLVTVPNGIDQKNEIDVTDGFKDFFSKNMDPRFVQGKRTSRRLIKLYCLYQILLN